jgi:alkyl hydroperoxide reductase subunit AhpC
VEKNQNRPFALLGVNTDTDRDHLRKVIARQGINWRSWWTGDMENEISRRYHVQGYPSIFVLDGNGVIRFTQVFGQDLDAAIEILLREAESGNKS